MFKGIELRLGGGVEMVFMHRNNKGKAIIRVACFSGSKTLSWKFPCVYRRSHGVQQRGPRRRV